MARDRGKKYVVLYQKKYKIFAYVGSQSRRVLTAPRLPFSSKSVHNGKSWRAQRTDRTTPIDQSEFQAFTFILYPFLSLTALRNRKRRSVRECVFVRMRSCVCSDGASRKDWATRSQTPETRGDGGSVSGVIQAGTHGADSS